jgi:hypothetical protein
MTMGFNLIGHRQWERAIKCEQLFPNECYIEGTSFCTYVNLGPLLDWVQTGKGMNPIRTPKLQVAWKYEVYSNSSSDHVLYRYRHGVPNHVVVMHSESYAYLCMIKRSWNKKMNEQFGE